MIFYSCLDKTTNFLERKYKMDIIIGLVVGAICGWLAGIIMKSSHGLIVNIILGVLGGFVGGLLAKVTFSLIFKHVELNWIGNLVFGVIGACILIAVARKIKKK